MTALIFPGNAYSALSEFMLSFSEETCCVVLATPTNDRLVVTERYPAADTDYAVRSSISARLRPEFLVPIVRRARDTSSAVAFVHTHPYESGRPEFSDIDNDGERHLAEFLKRRIPGLTHVALVIS